MDNRGMKWVLACLIVSMIITAGCTAKNSTVPVSLTVSAAKSLTDVLAEISTGYADENPEVTLVFNFGGSGALRQQIEQGAEADLYIPASLRDMELLQSKGLLNDATVRNILGNELVLIVPADSELPVADFRDVTEPAVKSLAIGEPASVPAGKYAQEVFTAIGVWEPVKERIVYAKDVRTVLAWVETGNAEAGVVYLSDALGSDQVKIAATAPKASHTPIIYPGAVLKASKASEAAEGFLDYLGSEEAKAVFEKHGYTGLEK